MYMPAIPMAWTNRGMMDKYLKRKTLISSIIMKKSCLQILPDPYLDHTYSTMKDIGRGSLVYAHDPPASIGPIGQQDHSMGSPQCYVSAEVAPHYVIASC